MSSIDSHRHSVAKASSLLNREANDLAETFEDSNDVRQLKSSCSMQGKKSAPMHHHSMHSAQSLSGSMQHSLSEYTELIWIRALTFLVEIQN